MEKNIYNGKNMKKKMYIQVNHFVGQQKLYTAVNQPYADFKIISHQKTEFHAILINHIIEPHQREETSI